MRGGLIVANISFTEEGSVVIAYMDTRSDIRNRGLLVSSHQIEIQPGDGGRDYGDEIEDVRDAALRLLADALEDVRSTDPVDPGVPKPEPLRGGVEQAVRERAAEAGGGALSRDDGPDDE